MKNFVFWTGVKSDDPRVSEKYGYGDFSWMDYSRKTWEYWCNKNGVTFIPYEKPLDKNIDMLKTKINWARWLDISDIVPGDYDNILSVDASTMVRWDAPNYFELDKRRLCAFRSDENLKWTYESAMGYKEFFNNFNFDIDKYIASGFIVFNKQYHEQFFRELKDFYLQNTDKIIELEDVKVKRGRDQPVINYLLQIKNIDVNYLPIVYGASHLYRHELFSHNWQLKEDTTPFFIKYCYCWIFSGYSDRGETRNRLMKETWEMVKDKYV